jgi:NADPH:quinone reductase-like Zn-dependent oxidoreductase
LRDYGHIKSGQRVLINGASSGVGSFAVQIAKEKQCHVTAVCRSAKIDMVRSLGADRVIESDKEDFTASCPNEFDLIFDAAGEIESSSKFINFFLCIIMTIKIATHSVLSIRRTMRDKGIYVQAGSPSIASLFVTLLYQPLFWLFSTKKVCIFLQQSTPAVMREIEQLALSGALQPVVDRSFPMNQVGGFLICFVNLTFLSQLADAIVYLESRNAKGKVVVQISKQL